MIYIHINFKQENDKHVIGSYHCSKNIGIHWMKMMQIGLPIRSMELYDFNYILEETYVLDKKDIYQNNEENDDQYLKKEDTKIKEK